MKLEQSNPLYRFHAQPTLTWNGLLMSSSTKIITMKQQGSLLESHVLMQHSCDSSGITRFFATFVWFQWNHTFFSQHSCDSRGITRFATTFVWFYNSSFLLALIIHNKHMIALTFQDLVGVHALVIWTRLPKWYTDVWEAWGSVAWHQTCGIRSDWSKSVAWRPCKWAPELYWKLENQVLTQSSW